MKKTFTINISGNIFHIDEDAYEKLQSYLRDINSHFGINEEGREIIMDIESRIAEIFQEKMTTKDQVINLEMVNEAIQVMGKPEEIFEEDDETEEPTVSTKYRKSRRRLYRDPDHRVFGGVASGISSYFGIDVVVIRLLFVLLFFLGYGFTFLIYIILWIVVPKAITTTQKLEMKGENVNISNIEKSIKDEYKEVKENFDKIRSKSGPQVRDGFDKVIDFLGVTLRFALKILIIILGIGFIFAGFISLISFLGSMIFAHSFFGPFSEMHFPASVVSRVFLEGGSITLFTIGLVLVVGIPLLLLIFAGLKLLFKFKTNNTIIGLSALAGWIGGIILLLSVSFGQIKSFMGSGTKYMETYSLENLSSDTLYLKAKDNVDFDWYESNLELDDMKIVFKDDAEMLIGEPTLDVEESLSNNFEIKIKKRARGRNRSEAVENAESIEYKWSLEDSLLEFDRYFTLPEDESWRKQSMHITLKIPRGKVIYLDESMGRIIHDVENVSHTWDWDMLDKMWIMKKEGLTQLEKK
ncbi:MAG: PspC domain-containing protein [Marinifilaceae bacterium]